MVPPQNDFESGLKPLWLRAQLGDETAYRQSLELIRSEEHTSELQSL